MKVSYTREFRRRAFTDRSGVGVDVTANEEDSPTVNVGATSVLPARKAYIARQ